MSPVKRVGSDIAIKKVAQWTTLLCNLLMSYLGVFFKPCQLSRSRFKLGV